MAPRFWAWPRWLHKHGVLGINRRNLDYLPQFNARSLYRLVDDKVLTKKICEEQAIPVPETYAVIERFGDVQDLLGIISERQEFVLKPARGSGGRGVLVVMSRNSDLFETARGQMISLMELQYHVYTTLSGLYSLGGQPDRVIMEQLIIAHPVFEDLAVGGTPDARVVMYRGLPVMAMLRLPTQASRGRANLHQGAVAAGIDLHAGETFGGVCRNRAITAHPDTGISLSGLRIPHWDKVLEMAKRVSEALKMGYVGVDILFDAHRGPIVLEVNVRPGLSVQIANRSGLLPILQRADLQFLAPETTTAEP